MENCIIGLPIYNACQYISHTIKNIELLEKCFKNIKIIFVYDKSKDNTYAKEIFTNFLWLRDEIINILKQEALLNL